MASLAEFEVEWDSGCNQEVACTLSLTMAYQLLVPSTEYGQLT
jgi:hypothetical protein